MKFFKPEIETKAVTDHIGRSQALPSHLGSMTASMAPYKGGWTAERALKQGFERVIWAWRGINAIASKEAELPLVQRQNDRLAGPVVLTGDPLLHLLNVRANHHETGPDFRNRCVAQSIMSPWGVFIEVLRDTDGRPAALELFPMGKTKPIRDRKNFLTEVVVETEGGDLRIPAQYPDGSVRVAWFRFPHPQDPWASDTPFEAAGISMELDFLARTYNKAFLENDGRPGGILGIKGHLNEDETEELQRRFRGGPSSAGHTTVLNVDDIKYQDTAMTPRDGQYAETRKVTKEDILLALGTPESVLGNASGRCVDEATEALTQRGWVDGRSLTTEDVILSMDPADGRLKWSPVREVYRNEAYDGPMYRLKNQRGNFLVTPGHNWAVHSRPGQGVRTTPDLPFTLKKVEDLSTRDRIATIGSAEVGAEEASYSTEFVEVVGWAVTEGYYQPGKLPTSPAYVRIRQNEGENAEEIRRVLKGCGATFGEYVREGSVLFNVRGEIAEAIVSAAPDKVLSTAFVLALTATQRDRLLQVMIDADGSRQKKTSTWTFSQADRDRAEAFVLVATLCGYTTSVREETRPYTYQGVTTEKTRWVVLVRQSKTTSIQHGALSAEHYTGMVWCPRTDYGTFIARRHGKVILTGNTFDNADTEKEVFWTETMKPILAVWARFWDSLTEGALEDQLFLVHDTSGVPELRRAAEALETRHQLEFIRGTMSLNDYNAALGRETKDHPLWRAHFIQRGFVVPGKPEDEEWLRENGYLDQGGQIDPDMDAGNETPRNVTDSLATTEASAQSDAIEEDEWAVLKKSAVQDTNDRLVAPWR